MNIERNLSGKSDEEIGQINIGELLEPLAKPLTTVYKHEFEGLPLPIQIPADEAHKYIHRVDALLETAGVRTANDLFAAQQSGKIDLSNIFAESMKSVDSSLDAEFRNINYQVIHEAVKISDDCKKFLTAAEFVFTSYPNQTKSDFFEQIKFIDSMSKKVNYEFENRKSSSVNEAIEASNQKEPSANTAGDNQVIVLDDVKKQQGK